MGCDLCLSNWPVKRAQSSEASELLCALDAFVTFLDSYRDAVQQHERGELSCEEALDAINDAYKAYCQAHDACFSPPPSP
jgi:hypothetical protein